MSVGGVEYMFFKGAAKNDSEQEPGRVIIAQTTTTRKNTIKNKR